MSTLNHYNSQVMEQNVGSDQLVPKPDPNRPFVAADFAADGKIHVLLAASGSVAAIKVHHIALAFVKSPLISVRIILTESAERFLQGQSPEQPSIYDIADRPGIDGIYTDRDEWKKPWVRGDPILHIELRRWADVMLVAPLSANTLAGIAGGFANNLLLSVVRAWDTTGKVDGRRKKIFFAPAMNTAMWKQPITRKHFDTLGHWDWIVILLPHSKTLACGDVGDGAMMDWEVVVRTVEEHALRNPARLPVIRVSMKPIPRTVSQVYDVPVPSSRASSQLFDHPYNSRTHSQLGSQIFDVPKRVGV